MHILVNDTPATRTTPLPFAIYQATSPLAPPRFLGTVLGTLDNLPFADSPSHSYIDVKAGIFNLLWNGADTTDNTTAHAERS